MPFGEEPPQPPVARVDDNGTEDDARRFEQNPYASPAPREPGSNLLEPDRYSPATTIVTSVAVSLIARAVLGIVMGILILIAGLRFPELFSAEELTSGSEVALTLGLAASGILFTLVYVAGLVMFFLWVYRANDNAWALGSEKMEYTAGWCVGWFFIPFYNLFRPYQAIREIYQASHPDADESSWLLVHVPALLGFWWAAWILHGLTALFSGTSIWVNLLSVFLGIVSALLTLGVVRKIHGHQQMKAQGQEARPSVPSPVSA